MSVDKRELILQQLLALGKTVPTIATGARNRGLFKTESRPAFVLMDGDESAKLFGPARSSVAHLTPSIVTLKPEIYFLLKEDQPAGLIDNELGNMLNDYRMTFSGIIASDATLRDLLGPNGRIDYRGCVTDLKSGAQLSGQMRLDFTFDYVFNP